MYIKQYICCGEFPPWPPDQSGGAPRLVCYVRMYVGYYINCNSNHNDDNNIIFMIPMYMYTPDRSGGAPYLHNSNFASQEFCRAFSAGDSGGRRKANMSEGCGFGSAVRSPLGRYRIFHSCHILPFQPIL